MRTSVPGGHPDPAVSAMALSPRCPGRCPRCVQSVARVVLQTFSNGTKHYRPECGKCGTFIAHLKRPEPWQPGRLDIEWRVAGTRTQEAAA